VHVWIDFGKTEVRYNWKADILYTGSRSNVELMF